MIEYLQHWWAGDLSTHYEFFHLSIPQLNKLAKLGQYLSGALTLFELVAFSRVMGSLRAASVVTTASYRVWLILFSAPLFLTATASMLTLILTHHHRWRRLPWIFATRARRKIFAVVASADQSTLVQIFAWLQLHPIPDKVIKATNFVLFLGFSATEIFTS